MLMFFIFGYKLISRNRNRSTISMAALFFIAGMGLLINILYRLIDNLQFNKIGNLLTISLTMLGFFHLLMFDFIILKSTSGFSLKKQLSISIFFIILLIILFLIGIDNGVQWQYKSGMNELGYNSRSLDPLDLGVPVWNLSFSLYGLSLTIIILILISLSSSKIYKRMEKNDEYRKKYLYTILGVLLMSCVMIGNYCFNYINTDLGRTLFLFFSLCIIPAGIFLYYGLMED